MIEDQKEGNLCGLGWRKGRHFKKRSVLQKAKSFYSLTGLKPRQLAAGIQTGSPKGDRLMNICAVICAAL